jgi:hypothetical protein
VDGLGVGKRVKNYQTKYGGKYQGGYGKVKEEDYLKDKCGDGEDLPKNLVADAERTVQGEEGNNCPR